LPIFVPSREQEKLADIAQKAGPEMAEYAQQLYAKIFELSRDYQTKRISEVV
jgi:chorismate mutase